MVDHEKLPPRMFKPSDWSFVLLPEQPKIVYARVNINFRYTFVALVRSISSLCHQTALTSCLQMPNPNQNQIEFYISSPTSTNPPGMKFLQRSCINFEQNWTSCRGQTDLVFRSDINADYPSSSCGRFDGTIEWFPQPFNAGKSYQVCATPKVALSSCGNAWLKQQRCIIIEVMDVRVRWGGFFQDYYLSDFTTSAFIGCTKKWNITVQNLNMDSTGPNYPLLVYIQNISIGTKDVVKEGPAYTFSWTPTFDMAGKSLDMCFAAIDTLGILGNAKPLLCKGGGNNLHGCTTDFDCPDGVCQSACIHLQVQKCQYCVQTLTTLELLADTIQPRTDWMRLWALNSYQGKTDAAGNIVGIQFLPHLYPQISIDDPGFITPTVYDQGRVLSFGVLYRPGLVQSIADLAVRQVRAML